MTINSLYLYIPILFPSVETQITFNEATQNNYKISFDEWYPERRLIPDLLVQHDIESAEQVNSPKKLIGAHQTKDRITTLDKKKLNIATFDKLDLRKFYVRIDGQRYPRGSLLINYEENDYNQQYKDLKLFFKEYTGEQILSRLISYPDMKTKNSIETIDLIHQLDHITPKRIDYCKNTAVILTMLDCF